MGQVAQRGQGNEPIEDPEVIREAMQGLLQEQSEFPIRVDGTSTLPYTSTVMALESGGKFLMKLVRPLPHELLKGALFRMIFPVGEQRFEAVVSFLGRHDYLQYRFSLPTQLTHADRRRERRFPFRPRESAYVSAQDGGYPGLGVTGALMNLGMGGLALRVDRVLRLEDGVRIPVNTAIFEPGKVFARIRVLDVPRLPFFEAAGRVAHATERGGEVILGFQFLRVEEEAQRALGDALAFREKVQRTVPGMVSEAAPGRIPGVTEGAAAPPREAGETPEGAGLAMEAPLDPLRLLVRRTCDLAFLDTGAPMQEEALAWLTLGSFHRITHIKPGEELPTGSRALMACLPEGLEPLEGVRHLEQAAVPGVPLVVFCRRPDPAALMALGPHTCLVPLQVDQPEDREAALEVLEERLGLTGPARIS